MDAVASKVLGPLLSNLGISEEDAGGTVLIRGADPVVASRYRPGLASAATLAAQGAAIATIWRMRSGRGQDVSVDVRRAAVVDSEPPIIYGRTAIARDQT